MQQHGWPVMYLTVGAGPLHLPNSHTIQFNFQFNFIHAESVTIQTACRCFTETQSLTPNNGDNGEPNSSKEKTAHRGTFLPAEGQPGKRRRGARQEAVVCVTLNILSCKRIRCMTSQLQ